MNVWVVSSFPCTFLAKAFRHVIQFSVIKHLRFTYRWSNKKHSGSVVCQGSTTLVLSHIREFALFDLLGFVSGDDPFHYH